MLEYQPNGPRANGQRMIRGERTGTGLRPHEVIGHFVGGWCRFCFDIPPIYYLISIMNCDYKSLLCLQIASRVTNVATLEDSAQWLVGRLLKLRRLPITRRKLIQRIPGPALQVQPGADTGGSHSGHGPLRSDRICKIS
jgi:hypothetical protein